MRKTIHSSFNKYIEKQREFPYLAAAEDVAGLELHIEVSEDSSGLVSGLFGTVQGQTATLSYLGPQLRGETKAVCKQTRNMHKHVHHQFVDFRFVDISKYSQFDTVVHT